MRRSTQLCAGQNLILWLMPAGIPTHLTSGSLGIDLFDITERQQRGKSEVS